MVRTAYPILSILLDLRIWVREFRKIGGSRSGIKLGEQRVVERAGLELSHPALGIVEIAKGDRLGRASRLAGGNDIAIADTVAFFLGLDPGCIDPLHAVSALLHHAAVTDRDLGIFLSHEAWDIA